MTAFPPERIAELRALCEAATLGPWENSGSIPAGSRTVIAEPDHPMPTMVALRLGYDDAAFIAAARTALPEALDEIKRLQRENAELRDAFIWCSGSANFNEAREDWYKICAPLLLGEPTP